MLVHMCVHAVLRVFTGMWDVFTCVYILCHRLSQACSVCLRVCTCCAMGVHGHKRLIHICTCGGGLVHVCEMLCSWCPRACDCMLTWVGELQDRRFVSVPLHISTIGMYVHMPVFMPVGCAVCMQCLCAGQCDGCVHVHVCVHALQLDVCVYMYVVLAYSQACTCIFMCLKCSICKVLYNKHGHVSISTMAVCIFTFAHEKLFLDGCLRDGCPCTYV